MRISGMMKCRLNFSARRSEAAEAATTTSSAPATEVVEWEVRPGGMLVQKRGETSGELATPNIRIRVAYDDVLYQISAYSQSTFGEVKKLLTAETGLQPAEQRLIFRGKERENGEYLDTCGVKDRSKVILIDDPESKERRMVEMKRKAKIEMIQRLIDDVSADISRLAEQVIAIEKSIAHGKKVAELSNWKTLKPLRQMHVQSKIHKERECRSVWRHWMQGKRVLNAKQKIPSSVVTTFEPSPAATQWELFD